ncbi:MAG: TIGR01777 family oxidoreductase [Opitutaceae bacterium]|nr:TIGR01777 family oxidoreductase [Opitutaceae bacterium]
MSARVFSRSVRIERPADEVFAWHERPGTFARLAPPWEQIKLVGAHPGIRAGARVTVRSKILGFTSEWVVEHCDYVAGRQFRDVMRKGPFARWEHLHRIEPEGENACTLTDQITFELPLGALGRGLAGAWVQRKLARMFAYRHAVTKADVEAASRYALEPRRRVLVSGASGLVARALIPFLESQGHEVLRLVRRRPQCAAEIFWQPEAGELDVVSAGRVDAVIHLAGENVAGGRWTLARKAAIMGSRVEGTRTLVEALQRLERRPEVFISASATGYYGFESEPPERMTEESPRGRGFLAEVCAAWESEAHRAAVSATRVAIMRFGVVLTPAGGALGKLLPLFRLGLGGALGSGSQGMSWISADDGVRAIYHVLMTRSCVGAFNVVAPMPVTNREFTAVLAKVLRRPAALAVPGGFMRLVLGGMAQEALLGGVQAVPVRLLAAGYHFQHEMLEPALRHELGAEM